MANIDYKELQAHVKSLNDLCGTKFKIIGVPKDGLCDNFVSAIRNGIDDIPPAVMEFYEANLAGWVIGGENKENKNKGKTKTVEKTPYGNTLSDLKKIAKLLNFEVDEDDKPKDIERMLLQHNDQLSEEDWNNLPQEVKDWDVAMTGEIEAAKATEAEEKSGGGEKQENAGGKQPATRKLPKEKKEKEKVVAEPRPDFKFTEGTSSRKIMDILEGLFENAKGAGVKISDLKDAASRADIKSKNISGRVIATINYASKPEGGEQVRIVKENKIKMLYPKESKE